MDATSTAGNGVNPHSKDEYRALRATIRDRGTTRVWTFVAGITAWAVSTIATLSVGLPPVAVLVPLLLLAATFEAVLALHVGVERIGRYLFVFHHDEWERAAAAFGKPRGAIAVDPLFSAYFVLASLLTLVPLAATAGLRAEELGGVAIAEAAFWIRIIAARIGCARQRAVDAERFAELRPENS
jgi:hypothetical protein